MLRSITRDFQKPNLNSTASTLVKTGFYFSFIWAGWIFHFYSLVHTILQFNQCLWKAYCVGGHSREQNRRDCPSQS